MQRVRPWFVETRPHFLLLTPVCIFLGLAVALYQTGQLNAFRAVLALVGGLLAHTSVNVLNDYYDFKSGVDLRTKRTPFSGGSGMLPAGILSPRGVYLFGLACLLALIPIGVYFTYVYGLAILPLGILGMLTVYFYTTHITKTPVLCLIAPGLGFGPMMVLGAYFTQTGNYSWVAVLASLLPGFLVSNLLLLNQFPDVEADATASRRHLPIVVGRRKSAVVYSALLWATYWALVAAVAVRALPVAALLGLLTLPLAIPTMRGVLRHAENIEGLVPFMAKNVLITLLIPLLAATGIVVQAVLL